MSTEIAKAYVQIIPSMKGVKSTLGEELGNEGDKAGKQAGEKAGGGFMSTIRKVIAAGAATLGIKKIFDGVAKIATEAVKGFADYEQLVGGVETLFKDSSDIVQQYAANAFQTAGLSANQYMETVTGFSASLLQSLGGDTEAAAKAADMAITDMSDNANKMGTSMESIQNAYQGFAKQNYTINYLMSAA